MKTLKQLLQWFNHSYVKLFIICLAALSVGIEMAIFPNRTPRTVIIVTGIVYLLIGGLYIFAIYQKFKK